MRVHRYILSLLPLLISMLLVEWLVGAGIVPGYILPAPSDVFRALNADRSEFARSFMSTSMTAMIGLALSFFVGTLIAMLLSLSEIARRAFLPYATFFQTVPIVAIAPVLVIWFGFGRPTVIASAFIVSIFPIIASSILGLMSADQAGIDLFRLHRATRLQVLWKLQLPSAIPAIFGGLRIASGLAVIGAIVGEFIAGGGLGEVVDAARTQQRLDKVFAAVLLSSFLGLVFVLFVDTVSSVVLKRSRE